MTNRLNLVLSVVIGGLAIHGVIAACGSIKSKAVDAQASDVAAPGDTSVPPGTIVAFAGMTAPAGWTLCDGSLVSRTTYAGLFAAIGINFGGGDGISTFNLPDLRGRFLRGMDGGAGRDPDAANRTASNTGGPTGDAVGSLQSDATAIPSTPFITENTGNHTHANGTFDRLLVHDGASTTNGTALDNVDGTGSEPNLSFSSAMLVAGTHTHRLGGGFGSGGDRETRPKNVAVHYIIKL
jgi:microcystin-dependent protein